MADQQSLGSPLETTLRDGTRVLVRLVEPADKQRLIEGFERLSARSRYLRFQTGVDHLSDRQVRYLTEVDQRDHVAWVAIDLDAPGQPGIGVARFVRAADQPDVAEAAVTVLDEYQDRGLGTLLLGILSFAAARRGIRAFRSYVLGENQAMLDLLQALGATLNQEEPGVYIVELALPETPDDLTPAGAAGEALAAITGRKLPPLRSAAPPVWVADDVEERAFLRDWLDKLRDHWS